MAILMLFSLFFIIIICSVVVFLYLSAKGIAHIADAFNGGSGTSSLPRAVKRSIQESRHYGRMINRTVKQCPPSVMRDRLTRITKHVDEWLANLTKLEQGLSKSYHQRNLSRELRKADYEIEQLRRELSTANQNEAIYWHDLISSKKQHQQVLRELQAFHTQAELKIRKIASDLGATHAEILLFVARGEFNENRLQRLDENLQDNLTGMRDVLLAMDEIGYSKGTMN